MFNIDKLDCLMELHYHFDGAIEPHIAKKLARMKNLSIPGDEKELIKAIRVEEKCKDFAEFLEKFDFPLKLLQYRETLNEAAYLLSEDLRKSGVIYAEFRLATQLFTNEGLSQEEALLSLIEGFNRSDLPSNIILVCLRNENKHEENMEMAKLAKKYLGKGVCALDLAGDEVEYPAENYKDIFDYANENGIPLTIHAGEARGADSVKSAIMFGAKRIGHGVRAVEDENVMSLLAEKHIALEMCPTSNLLTGAVSDIGSFPLRKMMENGVIVTINSDDPAVFGVNIRKEWELVTREFDLSADEIKKILLDTVNISFADDGLKAKLADKVKKCFSAN